MNIFAEVIDHKDQRYNTCGDWEFPDKETLAIRVSRMNNPDYEFLVQIHEQIEAYLCLRNGISEESVTEFDKRFEENRSKGYMDEPGNDPEAPYHEEHVFATAIESLIAMKLGVNWRKYEKTVNSL